MSRKSKIHRVEIEVNYVPFPNGEKRQEVYHTHASLFFKSKRARTYAKA
jgi:hypothetical protein